MNTNCSDIKFTIGTASCEVLEDHLLRCADSFDPPLQTYVNIGEYARKIHRNAVVFEAWADEQLVAMIAAYFNDRATGCGYITNVSALREYTGLMVASVLLRRTIQYATENGFQKIRLEVSDRNARATRFYARHGFVPEEQLDGGAEARPGWSRYVLTCSSGGQQ